MTSIIFFGECMIENHSPSSTKNINNTKPHNELFFGGDTLNTAIYFARVTSINSASVKPTHKSNVYYATGVGIDNKSQCLLSYWQSEGINLTLINKVADKTLGQYQIKNNAQGERQFIYQREDSAAKYYFQQDTSALSQLLTSKTVDYFYFSGISLAILSIEDCEQLFDLLQVFKNKGGKVVFDNNYRSVLWENRDPLPFYQQAMQLANIAFLTDEDEYALYGKYSMNNNADSIINHYINQRMNNNIEIVIKQGSDPCLIKQIYSSPADSNKKTLFSIKAECIHDSKIIDTCAAGDAFSAGYLAQRIAGENEETSAEFAHKLAGRVIQFSGAIIDKAHMKDLILDAE